MLGEMDGLGVARPWEFGSGDAQVLFHLLFVHFRNRILLFSKNQGLKKTA
jgi:hypothetical protein